MKRLLPLALLLTCVVATQRAAGQFVSTGPNGGAVNALYRDNTRILAAGSGGIYLSNDEGRSWAPTSGSPTIFGCDAMHSVVASGPEVYAGSYQSGIYRSSDGGATWQVSISGLRLGAGAAYTELEMAGPTLLTVRPDSAFIFVSSNQGINWAPTTQILGASARYLSVNNNTFYISTPQGLFTSPNGLAYTNINPSPADFGRLIWVNDTAYAATATGVKMSVNGGMNFTTVALAGRAVRYVAVAGSAMYAVVRGGAPVQDTVLYSGNGGATFSVASFPAGTGFSAVNDILATSGGLLVATDYGMYATRNSGATWVISDSGYHATTVRGLAVSGPYLLAGASPMGVFRTVPDSGALNWKHTGNRSQGVDGMINTMAARGAFVHAGGPGNYFRSTDSGATWTAGTMGVSFGNITSIYASPTSSDVWMIRNGNLHLSSNDGASFGQVVSTGLPPSQCSYVTRFDTILFVSAAATLYKAGSMMSFTPTTGITGRVTAMARTADSTIWAATDGFGLYSSKNGATWSAAATGILPAKINALIADSASLIAGTDNGLFANATGAWTNAGLQDNVVLSLAMRAGKLFVGTCSGAFSIPYKLTSPPPPTSVGGQRTIAGTMQIFPNPASGSFAVRVSSVASCSAEVVLRDMLGVTVLRQNAALKAGINELHIPVKEAGLAPGVYLVQVSGTDLRAAGRVVLR